MTENNNDNLLGKKFTDFEVTPFASSFNTVKTRVDRHYKRKRRRAIIWIICSILGPSMLYLSVFRNQSPEGETLTLHMNKNTMPEQHQSVSDHRPTTIAEIKPTFATQMRMPDHTKTAGLPNNSNNPSPTNKNKPIKSTGSHSVTAITVALSNALTDTQIISPGNETTQLPKPEKANTIDTSGGVYEHSVLLTHVPNDTLGSEPLVPIVLKPIHGVFSADTNALALKSQPSGDMYKPDLQLRAREFKPVFYVGVSYQPTLLNYKFGLNAGKAGFNPDLASAHVSKRQNNSEFLMHSVGGFKLGVILNKTFVVGGTFGYYKTKDHEIVNTITVDSTTAAPTKSNFVPTGNSTTPATASLTVTNETQTYSNKFSYLYASVDLGWIISQTGYRFMPAVNLGYHRVTRASYVVLDNKGYTYLENATQYLNHAMYSITLKAGFRKSIWNHFDFQLSPSYMFSASSLFNQDYFMSQKPYGFGLEGAIIYKFRP